MRLVLIIFTLFIAACDLFPQSRLDRVKDEGVLKVLTRNSATTYYEGPHGPAGLAQVLHKIQAGEADIAAAGLTVTDERKALFNFGTSYQRITPQLVYRVGTRPPKNLDALHGSLEVVAYSSHAERLRSLQEDHPELSFQKTNELDSEELLNLVWEQVIDYTVADSNEVAISRRFYPELRVAFDISSPEPLAWAFPPGEDRSLVDKADEFLNRLKENGQLDRLLKRYYAYVSEFDYVGTRRYMKHIDQRLPLYQAWFEQAGKDTGVDWRLLAAIGYQESHWNPKAVSPTGVRGLMMLTRATMQQIGIDKDRHDAQASIEGGARYITTVKKRIPARIKEPDRTWMALAAYNIGYGHLEDARILAENDGAAPDKWIDVKKYLPLLSQKKWYQQTRYGYARGREPVRYVENVRSYYDILVWITDKERTPNRRTPALTVDSPVVGGIPRLPARSVPRRCR
jgi:membrane-bound lytic murein transglycosylase F